ncbi:MAG: peptidylprolyl isomerase [Oscillospiraceae bacterium]
MMKIRSRMLALALAGAMSLSLAACGTTPKTAGPTLLPDNKTDVVEKLSGVAGKTPMLTMGGESITAEQFYYFLSANILDYQNFLAQYGQQMDWTQEAEGKTMADYMLEVSRQTALSYLFVHNKAKEMGIELSADQLKELEDIRSQVITKMGGEDKYANALEAIAVNDSTLFWINSTNTLSTAIQEAYFKEEGDGVNEKITKFVADEDLLASKHILYMTVDPATGQPLDDAAKAASKAKAEDAAKRLAAAEDPIALFDEIMNAESEDTGLVSNPDGYVFTKDEMVPIFENTTRALEFGKISEIVESDFGYHIILRLDPLQNKDIKNQYFTSVMTQWTEDAITAGVTESPEYAKVDPQAYFEAYAAYQQEIAAKQKAEADAAASPSVSPEASPETSPEASPAT